MFRQAYDVAVDNEIRSYWVLRICSKRRIRLSCCPRKSLV